tara:strand:+ start:189 stop:488 length:300 start_codon:yes stop_codon:yes gene_type:complete
MFEPEHVSQAIDKWLSDFIDDLLSGADRDVDAIYMASKKIAELKKELHSYQHGAMAFKDYTNKLREQLLMHELERVRTQKSGLELKIRNIIKKLGTSEN